MCLPFSHCIKFCVWMQSAKLSTLVNILALRQEKDMGSQKKVQSSVEWLHSKISYTIVIGSEALDQWIRSDGTVSGPEAAP